MRPSPKSRSGARILGKTQPGAAAGLRRRPHPLPKGPEEMIFSFSVSLLTSLIIGCLLSFIFIPHLKNGAAGLGFRLFAGAGLGIGVTSCVYFICLLAGLTRYVPAIDLVFCLVLGLLCFVLSMRGLRKEPLQLSEIGTFSGFRVLLAVIFSIELIASLLSFAIAFLKEPHGRWDAWLIWNMHARFLFRSGEEWRSVFTGGLEWGPWDYPLLLPLAIVRSWGYMGGESGNIPAVFALVFTLLVVGLLLSSLSLLRGKTEGILAAMVL